MLQNSLRRLGAVILAGALTLTAAGTALAYPYSVTYSGQGIHPDNGGYVLNTIRCGVDNGAEVDGPYILWVMTANRATAADITGPWGTAAMTQSGGGSFKYVSGWYDLGPLIGVVKSTYNNASTGNPQLVISHGCPPTQTTWCSPGFWKNHQSLWVAQYGNVLYNTIPNGGNFGDNPTILQVVTQPQVYGGPATNYVADYLSGQFGLNFTPGEWPAEHNCPL
jgi:hypothetical protein